MLDLSNVPARFVDVDFPADPNYVAGDITVIGEKPRCRAYGDSQPMVPTAEWKPLSQTIQADGGGCTRLVKWILNQSSEGSCVGNAGTQQHQMLQAKQFGKDRVTPLAAISLYQLIGRSAQSGANIGDCQEAMEATGIIPLDTPENRDKFGNVVMPPTGFRSQRPDGWQQVAKNFLAVEWFAIDTIEEMFSALLNQWPVVVGRAGHSIVYCDLTYKGDDPYVVYVNSWGNWGFAAGDLSYGFGADSMRLIRSSSQWAYAVRSVTVPPWITI